MLCLGFLCLHKHLLSSRSYCGDQLHAGLPDSITWSYHLKFLTPFTRFEVGWHTISPSMRFSIPSSCLWGQVIQPGSTQMSFDHWVQKTGRKEQVHFLSTSLSYRLFQDTKYTNLYSLLGDNPHGWATGYVFVIHWPALCFFSISPCLSLFGLL